MTKADPTKTEQPGLSDLGAAAAALEAELRRFEELGEIARRVPLNSEKNLDRAARATQEAAEAQERVAAAVNALIAAITVARQRQEGHAHSILERAKEIQARTGEFHELLKRFGALGEEAKGIHALVQEAAALKKEDGSVSLEALGRLEQVSERMASIVTTAQDVAKDAKARGIDDIERQADALKQQVQSARNKLLLLQQNLVARTTTN
ncbi:MAG: hypothetical protein JWM74_5216 [Myxococcaceae bacterium]|jgi:hypothetical protein|nr:hypothetical protein [Myxococcaceae bacterium]